MKGLDEGVKRITNIHWAKLLDIVLVNDTDSSGTILKGKPLFHSKIIHWSLLKQSQKTYVCAQIYLYTTSVSSK